MGAPRRCALRYGAGNTRIEDVGRRRQAARGRECPEMAERVAHERLPPYRTEEDNRPYRETVSDVNSRGGDSWTGHLSTCGIVQWEWVDAGQRSCRGVYGLQVWFLDGLFRVPTTTVCLFLDAIASFLPATI